ncbi:MAG: hypothetical protein ACK559_19460, partial [bacterium]
MGRLRSARERGTGNMLSDSPAAAALKRSGASGRSVPQQVLQRRGHARGLQGADEGLHAGPAAVGEAALAGDHEHGPGSGGVHHPDARPPQRRTFGAALLRGGGGPGQLQVHRRLPGPGLPVGAEQPAADAQARIGPA